MALTGWLPGRGWRGWAVLKATGREAVADRVTAGAASLAFHWLLTVFPAGVAAIGLAGLVGLSPASLHHLVHGASVLLPTQMSQVLDQALRNPPHRSAGSIDVVVGTLVALWSATEAMAALQIGLDMVCEVPGDRGFVGRRLMALPMLGATVLLGGTASVLLVLGNPLRALLPRSFPLVRPTSEALWTALRFGGAAVLVVLLLSVVYSMGPRREPVRWRWLSVGSVAATAGWLAASTAFAFYLDHFANESRSYGAFAGIAAMALWMYLTALVVLLGAELDTELARAPASEPARATTGTERDRAPAGALPASAALEPGDTAGTEPPATGLSPGAGVAPGGGRDPHTRRGPTGRPGRRPRRHRPDRPPAGSS